MGECLYVCVCTRGRDPKPCLESIRKGKDSFARYENAQVESMHLPWSLGADIPFPAEKAGLVVVQLVGIVPKDGRTMFPVAPNSSKAPACFALLRWNGAVVGRTPDSRELHKPTWDEQVRLDPHTNVRFEVHTAIISFFWTSGKGVVNASDWPNPTPTPHVLVSRFLLCDQGKTFLVKFSRLRSISPRRKTRNLHPAKSAPNRRLLTRW